MQQVGRDIRQTLGCGFAPKPARNVRVVPWDHPARGGDPLTMCPGYTSSLPEVLGVAHARLHWGKGELETALGEPATQALVRGIEMLEIETSKLMDWLRTPAEKGGGGT